MKKFFALMLCASLAGCAAAPTATTTEPVAPATLTDAQAAPAADMAAVPVPEASAAPEAAVATAAGAAPVVEAAPTAGQVVGDIAAQCAKKYAALKACDQTGLGAGICRKVVEKKYSSLACALVR